MSRRTVAGAQQGPREDGLTLGEQQVQVSFDTAVFVNCPFDDDYLPLLHALLFAIHDCGFVARFAVEDAGAAEQRIAKICRLIRESRLSIHDISRVELSRQQFPRFNMPFEAGLAYGATQFDQTQNRDMLVLEAEPFRDQITLSDLAGTDPRAHKNDPAQVVAAVRSFLARKKAVGGKTRGADKIFERYEQFRTDLPKLAENLEISTKEITSFPYLTDWVGLMGTWVLNS
jgi:hypothetical protein